MSTNFSVSNNKSHLIPLSLYFTDEDSYYDHIDNFPGVYDEEDIEGEVFEEVIFKLSKQYLYEAFDRLSNLFDNNPIESISLQIDLMGYEGTESTHVRGQFKYNKNCVNIGLMPPMIRAFLNKYWYSNSYLNLFYKLNFDHELIHALDTIVIPLSLSLAQKLHPREYFVNYLLHYRMEGLACLVTFLRGIDGEKSVVKAMKKFENQVDELSKIASGETSDWQKFKHQLDENKNDAYAIGQMMMLHVIWVKANAAQDKSLLKLVEKGMRIEFLSDEEISLLLAAGLSIDLNEYLMNLGVNGLKGNSFISSEKMKYLCQFVDDWNLQLSDEKIGVIANLDDLKLMEEELAKIDMSALSEDNFRPYEIKLAIETYEEQVAYSKKCKELYINYLK